MTLLLLTFPGYPSGLLAIALYTEGQSQLRVQSRINTEFPFHLYLYKHHRRDCYDESSSESSAIVETVNVIDSDLLT